MSLIQDRAVFVTANSINKSLRQAIIDGDIGGSSGGGGDGIIEIFNHPFSLGSGASSLTGVAYFRAPQAITLKNPVLQVWELGAVSSGNLEIDILSNSTPDDTGMTSIFSTKPVIDFSTASNYDTATGTRSVSSIPNGHWLRLDITSIPASWIGRFSVSFYAE